MVHFGYRPMTEEEAFALPVNIHNLAMSHFSIARGRFTIDRIIELVRNVVRTNDDIEETVPKDSEQNSKLFRSLYKSTIVYTCYDPYGNHRFAKIHIRMYAAIDPESIVVEAQHIRGDTRLSMEFFQTVRAYVLSDGSSDSRIPLPDLRYGFEDQYITDMSQPL